MLQIDTVDTGEITNVRDADAVVCGTLLLPRIVGMLDTEESPLTTTGDSEAPGAFVSLVVEERREVVVSTLVDKEVLVVLGLGGRGLA